MKKERDREGEERERERERKKAWELRVTGKAGAKTDSDLYHILDFIYFILFYLCSYIILFVCFFLIYIWYGNKNVLLTLCKTI